MFNGIAPPLSVATPPALPVCIVNSNELFTLNANALLVFANVSHKEAIVPYPEGVDERLIHASKVRGTESLETSSVPTQFVPP